MRCDSLPLAVSLDPHLREQIRPAEILVAVAALFGLVHIDYETLRRTPKKSFEWYADVIAAQPAERAKNGPTSNL